MKIDILAMLSDLFVHKSAETRADSPTYLLPSISKYLFIVVAFLVGAGNSFAQVPEETAAKISSEVNHIMSDYTDTTVIPTNMKDAVIVLSTKVITSDKVKSLWTLISACAVGKYLNDTPSASLNSVCFTDVAGMKEQPAVYYSLSASTVKSLQARLYSGEIELEEGQRIIAANLTKRTQEIH